jgi:hypothetical protein
MRFLFNAHVKQPAADTDPELEVFLSEIVTEVSRSLSDSGNYTILDALESTIWSESRPSYIETPSDILLVRLKREDNEGGAGVEILPELRMARFIKENYERAIDAMRERRGTEDILKSLLEREEQLLWIEKGGKKLDALTVLEDTLRYMGEIEGKKIVEEGDDEGDPSRMVDIDDEEVLPVLSQLLKASIQGLSNELQGLLPRFPLTQKFGILSGIWTRSYPR